MSRSGIVNVRMVITDEKIISNIDKIQKMINPKNKKQIVQLEEDTYFKDLIESVKTYLIEYPNKKNFPSNVYNEAYQLVEFAINQFEENTQKVEELIRQREENIGLAGVLSELIGVVEGKSEDWAEKVEDAQNKFSEDIIEALKIVGKTKTKTAQRYVDSMKILKARVNNLESNLHIEIDMERLEDSSKALSYIGIEISDALKLIPTPEEATAHQEENIEKIEEVKANKNENVAKVKKAKKKEKVQVIKEKNEPEVEENIKNIENIVDDNKENESNEINEEIKQYQAETTFKTKTTLWQRIARSKIVRAATYIFRIRIRIELPSNALPEGRGEE